MSVIEEVARLILEADAKGFADARNQVTTTQAALDNLTARYKAGAIGIDEYMKEGAKLQGQLDQIKGALNAAEAAVKKYGSTSAASAALANQATTSTRNFGLAALEGSRALEDLQYGLSGVINNVPSFVMALGGGAGLAAVISVVSVAVNQLVKHWGELQRAFEETTTIPETTGDVAGLERELANARDRMKELEKQSSVTIKELGEYNGLRTRTVEIEKQITEQKQLQADLDKLRQLEPDKQGKEERAKLLQGAIAEAPDIDTLIGGVERARRIQLEQTHEKLGKIAAEMPEGEKRMEVNRQAMAIFSELQDPAKQRENAQKLVREAVTQGQPGATAEIGNLMRFAPEGFLPEHVKAFEQAEALKPVDRAAEKLAKAMLDASNAIDEDNHKQSEAGLRLIRAKDKAGNDMVDAIDQDNRRQSEAGLRLIKAKDKEAAEHVAKGAAAFGKEVISQAKGMEAFQARGEAFLAQQIASGQIRMGPEGKLGAAGFDQLVRAISAQLKQEVPGLKPMQGAALAQQLAVNIEQGVGQKFLGQMGMAANAQFAAQAVVLETQQAMAQMVAKMRQIEARNVQLARNNRMLRREIQAPGPTNLPAGEP